MKKVSLSCPKCHYEFSYYDGGIQKIIDRTNGEIDDMKIELVKAKHRPNADQNMARIETAIAKKQAHIHRLEMFRGLASVNVYRQKYKALQEAILSICGESALKKCKAYVEDVMKPVNIKDIMKH